jgi:hypothetical protein
MSTRKETMVCRFTPSANVESNLYKIELFLMKVI